MEFSADAVAAGVVLRGLLNLSPGAGIYAGLNSPRDRLFIWSLALFTLFRIWDFKFDKAKMHQQTHPPSAVRFAVLMNFVCYDAVMDSGGMSPREYVATVKAGHDCQCDDPHRHSFECAACAF